MLHELDLYRDILTEAISKHTIRISFDNMVVENPNTLVEETCYKTLQNIRNVLDNDKFDDFECIEMIVKLLEDIGSNGGSRHNF